MNNLLLLTGLNSNEYISADYLTVFAIYCGAKLLKVLNKSVAWWKSIFLYIGSQV